MVGFGFLVCVGGACCLSDCVCVGLVVLILVGLCGLLADWHMVSSGLIALLFCFAGGLWVYEVVVFV